MSVHSDPICRNSDLIPGDAGYVDALTVCYRGEWFGECEFERCGGSCVFAGKCPCSCHEAGS